MSRVLLGVASLLLSATTAPAYSLTYRLTLPVEHVNLDQSLVPGLSVGDAIVLDISLDRDASDRSATRPDRGSYDIDSSTLTMPGGSVMNDPALSNGPGFLEVSHGTGYFHLMLAPLSAFSGSFGGEPALALFVGLGTLRLSAEPPLENMDDSIPTDIDLEDFVVVEQPRELFVSGESSGAWIVLGDIASLEVIPEPTTALLVALGLLGLGARRTRASGEHGGSEGGRTRRAARSREANLRDRAPVAPALRSRSAPGRRASHSRWTQ